MAKNTWRDYSTNPDENTDVGGVGIQGTNSPRNLDNAQREMMAQTAEIVQGNETVPDNWTWANSDDVTKTWRGDSENVPSGQHRDIDIEALYDFLTDGNRAPIAVTAYTASGTHTFNEACRKFMIVAVGAGGGSGGVDGVGSAGGSSAGGNSGFFGRSVFLARGVIASGTVTIGAAGTAGDAAAGNGGDGGDTTWSDGTNSFTWKGGKGSEGNTATSGHNFGMPLANGASTATLIGSYELGSPGMTNGTVDAGGLGGSNPWGTGGISTRASGAAIAGVVGTGYGAGASGAATDDTGANAAGAAGTGGRLEVWEY